jgi:hypothetical protein
VSEPRHWPEFFPPFVHTAAFVAEGRFLWLQASTSSMTGTQYYVVDTQLRRTSTVNLPGGVSVLSVLGKEMLVLAPGEGDVPRLQLFVAK